MSQLHKKFSDLQVKELFDRYLRKEIKRKYLQQILGLSKSRFFYWLQSYRSTPEKFTIQYQRESGPRNLDPQIEKNILKELAVSKQLIANPKIPIHRYNYSYVKDILKSDYHQHVAVSTIIDRAKKHGFYLGKHKKSAHDREVLTRYA
jgi:transposase